MELNQSKEIISKAINAALLKGCYSLDDVKLIIPALEKINEMPDVEFSVPVPLNEQP